MAAYLKSKIELFTVSTDRDFVRLSLTTSCIKPAKGRKSSKIKDKDIKYLLIKGIASWMSYFYCESKPVLKSKQCSHKP